MKMISLNVPSLTLFVDMDEREYEIIVNRAKLNTSGGDVWLDVSDDDTKTMIASAIRDALYCQDVYFGEDEMPDEEYAQMRDEEYAHYLDEEYAQDLVYLDELMGDV